jgi:hypothetical protein
VHNDFVPDKNEPRFKSLSISVSPIAIYASRQKDCPTLRPIHCALIKETMKKYWLRWGNWAPVLKSA